jgi:hypothetical protein
MPKDTGFHLAHQQSHYDVQGLVTGATYLPDLNMIGLVGYSPLVQPWIMLLFDYNGTFFFTGNKRKFNIAIGTSQTEAIASTDGGFFYITNERRTISSIVLPQQLHILDLRLYTDPFLHNDISSVTPSDSECSVFPNPAETEITIRTTHSLDFIIYNAQGVMMTSFSSTKENAAVSVEGFPAGIYFLVSTNKNIPPIRFAKL